jgi:transglutaminase-like putative cysteine protease/predicted glutamine amidotransferase
LCFDADASPTVRFQAPAGFEGGGSAPAASAGLYGWGVGWYPSSERGASVVKDPTSSGDTNVSDALGDWNRFRSTIFLCHLRGHQRPRKQQDAQPFVRSYGGRQWIFAHDGDLASDWSERLPLPDDPSFEPLGRTDSEHAFCWLLARIHTARCRSLSDVAPELLRAWMLELNSGGQLNLLLTDGEHLAVFRDGGGRGQLHWMRRIPPHASPEMNSQAVRISLDSPKDPNRTGLVFASTPLSADPWRALTPGELIITRRGSIVWDSQPAEPVHALSDIVPTPVSTAVSGAIGTIPPNPSLPGQLSTGQQSAAAHPLPAAREANFVELKRRNLLVTHTTHYHYEHPVERSSHRFLVRPVEDRQQILLEHSIEIDPPVSVRAFEDVFGNASLAVEINGPYSELDISARSIVTSYAMPPLEQRAAFVRMSTPPVWMPWQRQMLNAYLMPPELPETQLQELSQFAMTFVARNDYDLVGTLLDLNETLYHDFEYVSGSTTNETTAFQVFESRRGVCQDFANLMICLSRLLQVPARYRMGYIFTSADYENRIQSDASHAWVEVYIPQVGWHGFDPTNGIQVGADHVRVACGRNYLDATPTTGTIYRGGGTETLSVSVRVEEVPLPVPAPVATASPDTRP